MGKLYDAVRKIDAAITRKQLPIFITKGKIAIRAGFPLAMITPETPDDSIRLSRLKAAIDEVINEG